jgi:RNA 2',3'-cyclic 3'-phosphodiesterase
MTYRLFIAIELPEAQRLAIASLPRAIRDARHTKPEQAHLTMRFLGNTPEGELPSLVARLKDVRQAPFPLELAGLGVFPSSQKPRVLWVGISPSAPLLDLRRKIDAALPSPPEEQAFAAHITLARLGPRARQDTQTFLTTHAKFQAGFFPVDRFHLFRSQLQPNGAIHTILASFFLA